MPNPSQTAIPRLWAGYNTILDGGWEIRHSMLWDTRTYTDNSTTHMDFFHAAQANGDLQNGFSPLQNPFLVRSIGVIFLQRPTVATAAASVIDNAALLANTGVLALKINAKDYGPFPVIKLAPGCGIYAAVAGEGTEASGTSKWFNYANVGIPDPRAQFTLTYPLVIPAATKFSVALDWPSGAVDLTANVDIRVMFEGDEARGLS